MLAIAAGAGLVIHGVYRNNAFATAAFRGSDLVSLVVALPTLLVSTFLARRGSLRAHLVRLGALGYVGYTYIYTFGIAFNRLFLVYLALLSLSVFTMVRALSALRPAEIAARFGERTSVRPIVWFLWVVGGMLGLIELAQVVPTIVTGEVPDLVTRTGHLTGVVYVADLGLVVPLMLLAGWWLRTGQPWGYVTAPIVLVKGVTEGLALLSSNAFVAMSHLETDGPLMAVWVLIAAGSLWMLIRFLGPMTADRSRASAIVRPHAP